MKMAKRLLSIFMASAMVIAMASCTAKPSTSSAENAGGSTVTSNTPTDPALDTSKEVTLTMYLLGDAPADNEKVFEKINAIMKEKINVTLVPKYFSWSEWETKYPMVFASGEDFDMIYSADWAFYNAQATKQAYYEITKEALEKYAPMTAQSMYPEAWDQSLVMGKSYMLPMNYKEVTGYVYVARGDLMDKYKVDTLEGIDNVEKYLDAIAKNEKQLIPLDVGSDFDATFMFNRIYADFTGRKYVNAGGVWQLMPSIERDDPTMAISCTVDRPEYLQTVTKLKDWKDRGFWSKNAVVNTTDNRDSFKSGKSALALMNLNTAKGFYTEVTQAHPEWDIKVFDALNGANADLTAFWGNGMSIFSKSKNPERALMALDLLRNDEVVHNLFSFGIEGVHYEATKENRIKLLDANVNYPYDGNCNWGIRNDKLWKTIEGGIPNYDEIFDKWVETAEIGPYAFFVFDDSKVKNEIAAINDIFSSNYKLLNLGFIDDPAADIQKMSTKMKAAGVDKVYAEMHTQLTAFMAAKK